MTHLRRLELRAAPGLLLHEPLVLDGLAEGLNIILGPNASGKSTLARTVRSLLWPQSVPPEGRWVVAEWQDDAGRSRGALMQADLVSWTPAAPALPPPQAADRYALGLVDLLRAREVDQRIAQQLAVELAGGYDVAAAAAAFPLSGRPPAKLRKAVDTARGALLDATRETDARVEDERRLALVQRDQADARRAQALLPLARSVAELAAARRQLGKTLATLATFPPGMDRLQGDELDRLAAARQRSQEHGERLAAARSSAEKLRGRLGELALAVEPRPGEVAGLMARASELGEWERTRAEAERAEAAAEAKASEHARAVIATGSWASPPAPETLRAVSVASLKTLEGALERARAAAVRRTAAEAEVRACAARAEGGGGPGSQAEAAAEEEQARARAAALRGWLASPPAAGAAVGEPAARPGWLGWAAGLLALAGAVVLAWGLSVGRPGWAGVGGVLLGVGLGAALAWGLRALAGGRHASRGEDPRAVWRERATVLGVAPRRWDLPAVQRRLQEVEEQLAAATRAVQAWRALAAARAGLEAALTEQEEAEDGVRRAAAAVGLSPELPGLSLGVQARAVSQWLAARAEAAAATAARARASTQLRDAARALAEDLARLLPHAGGPEGTDGMLTAASASTWVEALRDRVVEWDKVRGELAHNAETAAIAARGVEVARRDVSRILEAAGVPGDAAGHPGSHLGLLGERLRKLGAWRALRAQADADRQRAAALEEDLDPERVQRDLGVVRDEVTPEEMADVIAALDARAERLESLSTEAGSLQMRLEEARHGHDLQDATVALEEAHRALATARADAAVDALGKWALEAAGEAQRESHAPPVLAAAQAWFGRFTRAGWRLELGRDAQFAARDTSSGQVRALDELSDATRVQLLLAARLAALEAAEAGGEPVPLCLDEVLSTTDPGRFLPISRALLEVARAGRQLFYFTADPSELARWEAACRELGAPAPRVIELTRARGRREKLPPLGLPGPPTFPPPPARGGRDRLNAWARTLGVHPPDGRRPVGAWHLLYLALDGEELEAVHACLRAGFETVGSWLAARHAGLVEDLIGAPLAARWEARAAALGGLLRAWGVGRGRPVTWEDVESSGAVTDTFRERVRAALLATRGKPVAFLDAVAELPRMRSRAVEKLRAHLLDAGAWDERSPLPEAELVRAGLEAVSAVPGPRRDQANLLAYTRHLLGLLGGGDPDAPRRGEGAPA